jgi:hypothetical protein
MDKKELDRIRESFQKRKSFRRMLFIVVLLFLIFIGLLVMPLMDRLGIERLVWAPFVYLFMFLILVAIAMVWRCPACNALLGDVFTTRFCPKCGCKFVDKPESNK